MKKPEIGLEIQKKTYEGEETEIKMLDSVENLLELIRCINAGEEIIPAFFIFE